MKKVLLVFILTILSAINLQAQTPPPLPDNEVLKFDTQLVEVPFVVIDKSGKPLLNLKKENFIVYEDGKKQEVAEFAATSAPFEVALLLDTSGSASMNLRLIKHAAAYFIKSLRPGDRVAIIAFDTIIESGRKRSDAKVISRLTDDRAKLNEAIERVNSSNSTPYYDALLQITEKVFDKPATDEFRGRRALVALSDGVDSASIADFAEVQEEISSKNLVSFFIKVDTQEFFEDNLLGDCVGAMRFSGAQIQRYYKTFYGGTKIEKISDFCKIGDFERLDISRKLYGLANLEMNSLAKNSGGKVFAVADLSEARSAFSKVADEIGTKYSLAYYPSNDKRDGTFRKIKVELKGVPAGVGVQAREGYTAPKN